MLDQQLTHGALRTRIARVRAAARDHEHVRARRELARFVDMLREHLAVESSMLEHLSEPEARVVRDGQRRILAAMRSLVADEAESDGSHAEALAVELDALVERQDVIERRGFRLARSRPLRSRDTNSPPLQL